MNQYIMLDLETTGLGPKATIIEIAMGLLGINEEGQIEVVDHFSSIVKHDPDKLWWQPAAYEMHKKSGLLAELRTIGSSGSSPSAACQGACYWLQIKRRANSQFVMCGNSIHTDREWLKSDDAWKPLEALFYHRMLDVSAFQSTAELTRKLIPEKRMVHRALGDVYESARLLNLWAADLA